jgi:hypothetical protein
MLTGFVAEPVAKPGATLLLGGVRLLVATLLLELLGGTILLEVLGCSVAATLLEGVGVVGLLKAVRFEAKETAAVFGGGFIG